MVAGAAQAQSIPSDFQGTWFRDCNNKESYLTVQPARLVEIYASRYNTNKSATYSRVNSVSSVGSREIEIRITDEANYSNSFTARLEMLSNDTMALKADNSRNIYKKCWFGNS